MNCPNCGAPERVRVRNCPSCGEAYVNEDLVELAQLEHLLEVTSTWDVPEALRAPHEQRLEALRARLERRPAPEPAPAPVAMPVAPPKPAAPERAQLVGIGAMPAAAAPATPVVAASISAEAGPAPVAAARVAAGAPPSPPKERVPFDQWLLSERNIRIALYAGGLLLVLAGVIFIGVRWASIPGPGKFAITLMVTGLMYLGGYLLFQRPAYRIGGIALLGVASGFLTLDFAVLQIYVLGPNGLRNDVMWLIASPICLLLYVLTAYWTRGDLFTYISVAAVGSTLTAALVVVGAPLPLLAFALAYSLLALAILVLARLLQTTQFSEFTRVPLLIVSQAGMPLAVASVAIIVSTGSIGFAVGSVWLAIATLGVGCLFYLATDALWKWLAARWGVAVLFPVTISLVLIELNVGDTAGGIILMVLALAYLGVGYALEHREQRRAGGWPLYASAYALAAFVTAQAIPKTDSLAIALFGDVVLLAVSAAIHRDYRWIYGAVWLFMLPVYLVISLFVPAPYNQGLLLGLLGLNYTAAGYALGRRELRLGGPFLTAAAFLSIVVPVLAEGNPVVASVVLAVIAAMYLLAAVWLDWTWLLLPALLAANLAVLAINWMFLEGRAAVDHALIISYAAFGGVLALGGLGLRRTGKARWAWPLYGIGAIDLAGAYVGSLLVGGWLAAGLSAVLAVLVLTFAWLERDTFDERKMPPLLAYLGAGIIFIGHFYVIAVLGGSRAWEVWPGYSAGLCALFVALAWLLRREPLVDIYSTPLRRAGLWLMAVPMAGSVLLLEPVVAAVTFAIAGVTFAGDAALRRILGLAYLGIGAFVVVIWAVLMAFDVSEPQAYVIPIGLALLGLGWDQRRRGEVNSYRLATLLGLIALMGSAFVQSLPRRAYAYAALLAVESLVAVAVGARARLRGYVQVGALALIANAIAQLGPGFVDLPRWVHLGVTGAIFLGGGLAALFKREQLLSARQELSEQWRQWEP